MPAALTAALSAKHKLMAPQRLEWLFFLAICVVCLSEIHSETIRDNNWRPHVDQDLFSAIYVDGGIQIVSALLKWCGRDLSPPSTVQLWVRELSREVAGGLFHDARVAAVLCCVVSPLGAIKCLPPYHTFIKTQHVLHQGDLGGTRTLQKKWTTFQKARLECSLPERHVSFNNLRAVFTLPGQDWRGTTFFGIFHAQWWVSPLNAAMTVDSRCSVSVQPSDKWKLIAKSAICDTSSLSQRVRCLAFYSHRGSAAATIAPIMCSVWFGIHQTHYNKV